MMRKTVTLVIVLLSYLQTIAQDIPASATFGEIRWDIQWDRSDDFNDDDFDINKWENKPGNVGVWTWDNTNNISVQNGIADLKVTYDPHVRGWFGEDKELYFKSGMIKSYATGIYGYYEAKIKGADIYPGVCPAFWLYSDFDRSSTQNGHIVYSEIDVVELQQHDWFEGHQDDVHDMDLNLHAVVIEGGKEVWKRPKPNKDTQLNKYRAPWDPRADFHIYAVENRPDSVLWYIDGELVAKKKNLYWHRPMNVTVSMGLRTQFVEFKDNKHNPVKPTLDQVADFPTSMQIDYVKTWEALPSLWVDDKKEYTETDFVTGEEIEITCHFHAGSGDKVLADQWNGITVKLIEKNASGSDVNEYTTNNTSVIGLYAGSVTLQLSLAGVPATSELPEGHYYVLTPVYKSSKDGGTNVFVPGGISPINIVDNTLTSTSDVENKSIFEVYPNPSSNIINIKSDRKLQSGVISVLNLQGEVVLQQEFNSSNEIKISVDGLVGQYLLKIANEDDVQVQKIVLE